MDYFTNLHGTKQIFNKQPNKYTFIKPELEGGETSEKKGNLDLG